MAAFLDANVFLYAAGAESPHRAPCLRVLRGVAEGRIEANTNTKVVQEVLHVLTRRGSPAVALRAAGNVLGLFPAILPVTAPDLRAALDLLAGRPELPVRDAIHAATALRAGMHDVVSVDRHFDLLRVLRRIDPLDEEALGRLGA